MTGNTKFMLANPRLTPPPHEDPGISREERKTEEVFRPPSFTPSRARTRVASPLPYHLHSYPVNIAGTDG